MRLSLRNNALLVVSALVWVVSVGLVSVVIDRQYYSPAKRSLIQEEYIEDYFEKAPIHDQEFLDNMSFYLVSEDPRDKEQFKKRILEKAERILAGDTPFIAFELRPRDGSPPLVWERRDARNFNTFRNSLIFRDFRAIARQKFASPGDPERLSGDLLFTYTSPVGFEPLENLTRAYWLYLAIAWAAISGLYGLTLWMVVLPLRKVTEAIQESRGEAPRFIARPHSRLERLYNSMARDASLTALQALFRRDREPRLRMSLDDLFEFVHWSVKKWFGFNDAGVLEMAWAGPATLTLTRQTPAARADAPATWGEVLAGLGTGPISDLRAAWEGGTQWFLHSAGSGAAGHLFLGLLPGSESGDTLRVLFLRKNGAPDHKGLEWYEATARGLYRQVCSLVESVVVQSRELFRERSQANISLSRNLGHDLTNIIATNKLELMTVQRLVREGVADPAAEGAKARVLRESVGRLLDNTRSLQEIVNLYRAYEYLNSPRYEQTDLSELIRQVIEIFRLSASVPVDVACEQAGDMPEVLIEPRLVKLALFNILMNALDSIRRLPADQQDRGRICVQSLHDRDKDDLVVRVSDTGPGIRTPDGELAGEEVIARIFDMGYTTKTAGEGEGLGLNWVRSILTEFHDGELSARNLAEGGACFEFRLRLRQRERAASPSTERTRPETN